MRNPLHAIPEAYHRGVPRGITSVCSAHPLVIEAALLHAREHGRPALIEATCNQVNQEGGYTGMTPADFRAFVERIAERSGCREVKIVLGGDHLGPNPWKDLPAEEAMARAEAMIAAYANAGFSKLHLDTSMGCRGEPVALDDERTAQRAARLAEIAEAHAAGPYPPVYVIGTEVPVPGGALEEIDELEITDPEAVALTHDVHRRAFVARGLEEAFSRVIALVVQPGVEFGHSDVVHFVPERAADLSRSLARFPGLVFEAHSTDYQTGEGLRALVHDGFAILKVGPWLTFALREALYGLDAIADVLDGHPPKGRLMGAMEAVMQAAPESWEKYYTGSDNERWLQRHFSLSDRIRYYWPSPEARSAVQALMARLEGRRISGPLLSQYLPGWADADAAESAHEAVLSTIRRVLALYEAACDGAAKARSSA